MGEPGVSWKNSTNKLAIVRFRKEGDVPWVYGELLKYGRSRPRIHFSLADVARIVHSIARCEDERYPPPANGSIRLLEFLRDVIAARDLAEAWPRLAKKYQIPERDGDRVVDTNGAKPRRVLEPLNAKDIPW